MPGPIQVLPENHMRSCFHRFLLQVEHHNNEDDENHDGTGIDDHFQCGDKRRAEYKKYNGDSEKGDNQIQQA